MPRYENDPTKVAASIEVFPKDDYEFIVGEPKAFERTATAGHQSYGIRVSLAIAEGPFAGKRTVFSTYQHSEGAKAMEKRFIMAVLGFMPGKREIEKQFDAEYAGKDWGIDTDSGAVGDMYRELTGKRVIGSLDTSINKETGDEQQNFVGWRPLGS